MPDQPDHPARPWLESDDEFEGVGAHTDNPRFDLATAIADQAALDAEVPDASA